MNKIEASGESIFPVLSPESIKLDLFTPVVPIDKLHPSFKALMESPGYYAARKIILEILDYFFDPDGNFVEQFQTSGFDARMWELYIYRYLRESGFELDRRYRNPDFYCTKFGATVCIEAMTVYPTQDEKGQIAKAPTPNDPEEIKEKLMDFIPIKFGSALFSKLKKRYWEIPHIKDKPIVFAIADFHNPFSLLWTYSALPNYLYGCSHEWSHDENGNLIITPKPISIHKVGEKEIPSGFFSLPDAENISAVLFSNSGTIAKFNRMGHLAGYSPKGVQMIRTGDCYNDDPKSDKPLSFSYVVGNPHFPETWGQGLSMFHNPNALHPIYPELFSDIAHHIFQNGQMHSFVKEFHPFASITQILIEK